MNINLTMKKGIHVFGILLVGGILNELVHRALTSRVAAAGEQPRNTFADSQMYRLFIDETRVRWDDEQIPSIPLLGRGISLDFEAVALDESDMLAALSRLIKRNIFTQKTTIECLNSSDWKTRFIAWECVVLTVNEETVNDLKSAFDPLHDVHSPLAKHMYLVVKTKLESYYKSSEFKCLYPVAPFKPIKK
jgi:hypothetical protein